MAVTFYGDPHGSFGPLLAEWEKRRPNHVVLLGDMDLERPLKDELEPLFRAGTTVWWILGNHDGDREAWYRNLVESHPDGDLGGRVHVMDRIRVAGLSGVYRGSIWHPNDGVQPKHLGREAYLATLPKNHRWKGGLPLRHRATTFPEDHRALERCQADILVSHEAPSTFERGGVTEIDTLARTMGVRLVVHGHHHRAYAAALSGGIREIGKASCR